MGARFHLELFVHGAPRGKTQPVPVEEVGDHIFRILRSPGFVEGIAAGDVVRVLEGAEGRFEVLTRGGNLSVKVLHTGAVDGIRDHIARELDELGGFCDGSIHKAAVFTIPVRIGFEAVERILDAATAKYPGAVWYYGNVYGADGKTPLNWWQPFLEESQ